MIKKIIIDDISLFITLDNLIPKPFNYPQITNPSLNDFIKEVTEDNVDIFFGNYLSRSGRKVLSSFVINCLDNFGTQKIDDYYTLSDDGFRKIFNLINYTFVDKRWKKIYDTYRLHYDVLSPYDIAIDEEGTDTLDSENNVDSNTNTNSKYNSNTNNKINGFNSNSPIDRDSSIIDDTTIDSDTTRSNTKYKRTNPYTRNLTRKGNIGNITKQELIEKERGLWKYNLFETIYSDLDRVLTRSKYI